MNIEFVRSGGFAGLKLSLTVQTEDLSSEEASRLRRLVEEAGFFDLEPATKATPAPDRFEYHLAIESQVWGRHTVELPETAVPDEMRPLLEHLTKMAMSRPHEDAPDGNGSASA
ncbi:MAG TPA: protealysin inhibitor emfourin [Anaerolineales bacterium]